jgi:Arc/MetJ-type ribon-helix-helix transcriptional regulator
MTIIISKEVEDTIKAAVRSGEFASADEMITRLVQEYGQRTQQTMPKEPASQGQPATARKPIWEVFQELSASVPDEDWDRLPPDLSAEHDHYIYGTPKRNEA